MTIKTTDPLGERLPEVNSVTKPIVRVLAGLETFARKNSVGYLNIAAVVSKNKEELRRFNYL